MASVFAVARRTSRSGSASNAASIGVTLGAATTAASRAVSIRMYGSGSAKPRSMTAVARSSPIASSAA